MIDSEDPANDISRPGHARSQSTREPGLTEVEFGCEQDTTRVVGMTIQRVPEVPFAQIANSALRDRRLSFKARGVLALVLSNAGDWEASRQWLVNQSERDGRHAVQEALNELTDLGYREVRKVQKNGKVTSIVEWRHEPQEPISRPTENLTVGKPDRQETRLYTEHHPKEHHQSEHNEDLSGFDDFWKAYPLKKNKGAAKRAWKGAINKTDAETLIAGALKYRDALTRDPDFTAHASSWLNGERWEDEDEPRPQSGPVTVMDMYADEPCEHGDPMGEARCPLCRRR